MSIDEEMERFQREGQPGEIFGEYLMRTADRREAEYQQRRAAAYAADNARLRALVNEAEWAGISKINHDATGCPWCTAEGMGASDNLAGKSADLVGVTLESVDARAPGFVREVAPGAYYHHRPELRSPHDADCPAFHADGRVR